MDVIIWNALMNLAQGKSLEEKENCDGEDREEAYMVPGDVQYSQRTVAYQNRAGMQCTLCSVFGEALELTALRQVKVLGVKRQIDEGTAFCVNNLFTNAILPTLVQIDFKNRKLRQPRKLRGS